VQNFTLWQQATIEYTRRDHSIIAYSRHIYMVLFLVHIPFVTHSHRQGCRIGEFIVRFRKSGEFFKRLATYIVVWRFGEFLAIFWRHLAPIFWFGEMYDLHICTYLLTYSYVDYFF